MLVHGIPSRESLSSLTALLFLPNPSPNSLGNANQVAQWRHPLLPEGVEGAPTSSSSATFASPNHRLRARGIIGTDRLPLHLSGSPQLKVDAGILRDICARAPCTTVVLERVCQW
jgi:hypothetical protein